MLTKSHSIVASFVLSAGLITGCASTNRPAAASEASAGMMCPKCETVWVSKTTDQGLKTQRLAFDRKMICPECDEQARAYLEEGKTVLHNCPTCKVTPRVVAPVEPSFPKGPRS